MESGKEVKDIMFAPNDVTSVDYSRLVELLEGLDDVSLARLILRIPGAAIGDVPSQSVPARVYALIRFAQSVAGPGLPAVAQALVGVVPKLAPQLSLLPADNGIQNNQIINPVESSSKLRTKCVIALDHYFTGRVEELNRLRIALTGGGTAGVTQAIAGLGGIGKSSLARAYAREHDADYDAIFYLNASSVASLNASYREIDRQFDPPTPAEASDESVREKIQAYLHSHDRYLLLVDNADFGTEYTAEALKPYLPGNVRGHVLITTRSASSLDVLEVSAGRVITLHDMEPVDAATLLWERVYDKKRKPSDAETKTLMELAKALFCFPLALEQAAAYIAERKITHTEYLQDQAHGLVELLNEQRANVGDWAKDEQYRRAVKTTWEHNVQALQETGKVASVELLMIAAHLAPEAIPLKEIVDGAVLGFPNIKAILGDREPEKRRAGDYANLLKPLLDYSLVTKDADRGTFDIHRLLQEVIRHGIPAAQQVNMTIAVIQLLNNAFPAPEFTNWATCERLTLHMLNLAEHARGQSIRTSRVTHLLNQTAYYLYGRGRYWEALPLLVEALAIDREVLPDKHPLIASSLNNLAQLHQDQGDYPNALRLMLEALAIHREVLPNKHPDIATSLNNLAALYKAQGDYPKALPLLVEALAIHREVLPDKHPLIATSLNNLAQLHQAQGDYPKALPLLVEALAIDRASLPVNHPDLAIDLNNLAALHHAQGDYPKALPLLVEALAIRREVLPDKHPDIATSLSNLAALHQAQGDYPNALPLLVEALAIMRSCLEADNHNMQMVLQNAIGVAIETAIREKGLTQEAVAQMSEAERQSLFTGIMNSFKMLLKVAEARLL